MNPKDKIHEDYNSSDDTMEKLFYSLDDKKAGPQKNDADSTSFCNKGQVGVAACLMSAIFAGAVPSASRYVQDKGYTPYQIIFFNDMLIALASLLLIIYYRTCIEVSSYKERAQLILQGVFRFVNQLLLVMAYQHVPPANAENVCNASIPVFVVIVAGIFLHEIPSLVVIFGNICNITGVVLLGYENFVDQTSEDAVLGFVLAVTAALLAACINTNIRSLLQKVPKRLLLTCAHGVCSVLGGILACILSSTWQLDPLSSGVLVVNVVTHALFIALAYAGLELVEVNTHSALRQVNALSAYAIQWVVLGFYPKIYEVIGLICIAAGTSAVVIVGVIERWKEKKHNSFVTQMGFNDDHKEA